MVNGNVEEGEIRLRLSGGKEVGNNMRSLQKEANKLRADIKDLTPGTEAFILKTKQLAQVEKAFGDIKDEIKDVKDAQKSLSESFEEYFPFAAKIQVFVKGFRDLKRAKDAATISTKLLNAALLLSGFGAILVILGAMYTYLTGTTKGTNMLRRAWEPLNQIIQRFIGFAQQLGEYFFDNIKGWFTDPIGAIKSFGQALVQNVINRFTAIAKIAGSVLKIFSKDWKEGLKELANGIVQAGTGIENGFTKAVNGAKNFGGELANAAKDGLRIANLAQKISESQIEATKRSKELANEYKRLSEIAEDTSKTAAERAKAGADAKRVAEEEFQINKNVLDLQIEKMQLEHKANDTSYEQQQELADLIGQRTDMETAMVEKRTTANSKFNTANQAIAKEEMDRLKKHEAEEKRIRDEKLKAEQELSAQLLEASKTLQDQRISLIKDETDRKVAEVMLQYERELQAFKGSQEQKDEFAILKAQELDHKLKEIDDADIAKRREEAQKQFEEESEIERLRMEEKFYNRQITEEDQNEKLYQMQVDALKRRLLLLAESGSAETLEYQKIYTELAKLHAKHEEDKTKSTEENEAKRKELQTQGFQMASQIFGDVAQLLGQDEKARKKNYIAIQAMQVAQVTAASIVEIQEIFKSTSGWGPVGWALGIAKALASGIRSASAIARLKSQKFQLGGPVFGPSHQNGGVPFSVQGRGGYEMEGGEIIMTKGVYQNPVLRTAASMINVAGGGAAFASGGVVPIASTPMNAANPGTVINNINNTTGTQDSGALINEVRQLRNDMNAWQREFEVKLSLTKLEEETDRKKRVEIDTSF